MANYINPHTGSTIGYLETSGTTVEPFQVPMMWQASTLSYVTLLSDASGNLLTSGGGGGGGGNLAAGLTGNAVPTYGDYIAFSGAGGLLTGVSASNPLPCTFPGSAGNAAAGLTGASVPGSADYSGWNNGGNLVGTSLTSALPVQPGTGATFPVSGTFWQATQPVSIAAAVSVVQSTAANLNATVTGAVAATQSGTWNIGSITTLPAITGTVTANQGGSWTTARTWTLASGTDSVTTVPSGTQTVSGTLAATQSGTWSVGRTWTLASGTDSVTTVPSGTQTISGTVGISGTVPVSVASLPTASVNVNDGLGNAIASQLYPGIAGNGQAGYSLQVDPTNAGTDGIAYSTTTFPQVGIVAARGIDGYVHSIQSDQQGVVNVIDQNSELHISLLQQILTELKILNAQTNVGLNVKDDVDNMRNEPYFSTYQ